MRCYIATREFNSKIFNNLRIPKGSTLELHFGILYYNNKPVIELDNAFGFIALVERN